MTLKVGTSAVGGTVAGPSSSCEDTTPGAPLCRWRRDDLIVDVMPVDVSILGFSNRWYPAAIETAQTFDVAGHDVRVVTPALFIAAKLVAFHGRGGDDVFASHDLEDRARRDALIEEAIVDAYRPTRATSWSGTSTRRCISHTGSTWKSRSGIPSALST